MRERERENETEKDRQLCCSYSGVSDQFDSILLSSLLHGPLPIDLDAVKDPILVEVVDGGRQVVEAVLVGDERAERVS